MRKSLILASWLSLLACDSGGGDGPAPTPTVKGTATAVTKATASASAKGGERPMRDKPAKPKAYEHPDEIGTLPEGVGIAVSDKAPDFELKQSDGSVVKLSELLKKSEVLLTFYRGGW